jgi:K+-transporting ATPase ATPase A chain
MIGRIPKYLGKTLDPAVQTRVVLYIVAFPAIILVLTAIGAVTRAGAAGLTTNHGTHGLTEMLFAYTSAAANNGLTMASFNANTPFFNLTTAIAMVVGRFVLAILALAVAGYFARQELKSQTGLVESSSWTFAGMLFASILIISALGYFIVLVVGPIAEAML